MEWIKELIRGVVKDVVRDAVLEIQRVNTNQSADLARLILESRDGKYSMDTLAFMARMDIDPKSVLELQRVNEDTGFNR